MNLVWIAVAVVAAALLLLAFLGRQRADAPVQRERRPDAGTAPPATMLPAGARPAAAAASVSASASMPPELAALRLTRVEELPAVRTESLVKIFRDIPRPPKLLQHLVSVDLLHEASSAQLVDLIASEPVIAGKLLAAVNSPLYGLQTPVASVGQAVTYLGLTQVRTICLQYVLMSAFRPDAPERKQALETLWAAGAVASELAQFLAPQLPIEDQGAVVAAVLLSFLGPLAVVATVPIAMLRTMATQSHLERTASEQRKLGLGSAEIGRLLMRDWGLPERVVADTADAGAMLVTPYGEVERARALPLALGYLCARLGERLASGQAADLQAFDLATDPSADFFHVRACLDDPRLQRLPALLQAPALAARLQQVLGALRAA